LKDLETWVDRLAYTHTFRHGETDNLLCQQCVNEDAFSLAKHGTTELMKAAAIAKPEELKTILETGTTINAADETGWTALMYAAANGKFENVQVLLDAGAAVNSADLNQDTALLAASEAWSSSEDLQCKSVEPLMNAGAAVNVQDKHGLTPLMLASGRACRAAVAELLAAGADPSAQDQEGKNARAFAEQAQKWFKGQSRAADALEIIKTLERARKH
jgi:ankyrin repeat protein